VVLTDIKTSFDNLRRFLKDNKADFLVMRKEVIWTLTVTKTTGDIVRTTPEEYCNSTFTHFEKGNFIVVVSSDKWERGR